MSQVITEEGISPQQEEALERIFQEYAGKKGALIQVLHAVQNVLGYLPREALKRVARALNIPVSEVYG
ncbi:MAG: NAD(P)H-dependent oxidoreductase subunit E, partial [Atribacterota bacterium]|nr:NAD(P)H-dependent oxidoreductase subunit E [Atribacterota bacterium]